MTRDTTGPEPFLYRQAGPVTLYLGDARDVLAAMPAGSVDCLVTSPPYYGLRDYGTGTWTGNGSCPHPAPSEPLAGGVTCSRCGAVWRDPQIGLEPAVEEYVERLAAVFDEAKRVLSPTGTCWLNLGDSYTGGRRRGYDTASGMTAGRGLPAARRDTGLPAKNLLGVPWRVAFALQQRGWILRNAVVWAKTNAMPSPARDRFTATYELVFLLTRSPRYWFDLDPVRVPLVRPDALDGTRIFGGARKGRLGGVDATAGCAAAIPTARPAAANTTTRARWTRGPGGATCAPPGHSTPPRTPGAATPGDVWHLPTRPYRGAHVAPFPLDQPLRAIAAGCPPGGTVCDPFSGAATTGLAALQLGRRYIGIDINPDYHDQALRRLEPLLGHCPPPSGETP